MKTRGLNEIIAEHPFFRGLPDADCALIAGCGRNVHFAPGARIFRHGDPADTFYVMRQGHVALEMATGGPPLTFETTSGGDVLNANWIVPPYRCSSDARAIDDTRAIAFDAVCLRGKCDQDPRLGYELMRRFVPRVVERLEGAQLQALNLYGGRTAA